MSKLMLIDAAHAEETRVAVVDGHRVEEFDFESRAKKQLRGNIYLAKVTRVEPSLQAAFVEYGGNRHGFLAFNEIHPDYFQIPVADREALMREAAEDDEDDDVSGDGDEADDDDELPAEEARLRRRLMRKYKIQEVIRRRQILLIQVVKEERGNKGAALTTYLSLAGRYCVLMPNTARGGGISRKITAATDRKRLKAVAQSLEVPHGMGLIIRTAGAKRTKQEIKRDYDYLLRLWESIRETTLNSIAPALIYEEENLVRRAVRDMFDKDIDAVMVDGEEGWREARDFMRMLMPSQAKKVQLNPDPTPLFVRHKVEDVLQQIWSPVVSLKSGGYLVINQTEALVAIDVNSGKSTKERNIEATALKTNLEAAEEAARQLRLRDLAGLIVIDFIDMEESKNDRAVEKRLKEALADDRARVQMGKISPFGLMEISRQRRRTGLLEGATHVCEQCNGSGRVRAVESAALAAMRGVELECARGGPGTATVRLPLAVALYVLNHKRDFLIRLEREKHFTVAVVVDDALGRGEFTVERTATFDAESLPAPAPSPARVRPEFDQVEAEVDDEDDEDEADEALDEGEETAEADAPRRGDREDRDERGGRRRRRRRRGGRRDDERAADAPATADSDEDDGDEDEGDETGAARRDDDREDGGRRRRRRGRRGGRRAREEGGAGRDPYQWVRARTPSLEDPYVWFDPLERLNGGGETTDRVEARAEPRPRREAAPQVAEAPAAPAADAPKRRRVRRKAPADLAAPSMATIEPDVEETAVVETPQAVEPEPVRVAEPAPAPAPEPEPEPAPVVVAFEPPAQSEPEPEPAHERVLETASAEPDPAEIRGPAPAPRRGWWRRGG